MTWKTYGKLSFALRVGTAFSALVCGAVLTADAAPSPVDVKPADPKAMVKVEVFPPDINLNTRRDRPAIRRARYAGRRRNARCHEGSPATLADGKLARLDQQTVYPTADGSTTLNVTYGQFKSQVPVVVKDAAADRPISFHLDVMPVFMRSGCNTGSCHGAARGKDGFMLSLFGYDPKGDHMRITHENVNRRINLALPEESLLLEKNDGTVPHTGGKRFDRTSEYYLTLLEWLKNGAPLDATEVPKVVKLELFPPAVVLEGSGATQQMIARAIYADGSDRDVTHLAVFLSNNDNSAPSMKRAS